MAVAPDLYPRIKAAARTTIIALNLTSTDPAWAIAGSVYEVDLPSLDNVALPCVQLTSEGEREEILPGATEHRDMLWPVRVFLMDRAPGRDPLRRQTYKAWRRQILEAFHDLPLTGVAEVVACTVVPEVIYDPALLQAYQLVVGALLLRFWTRERKAA